MVWLDEASKKFQPARPLAGINQPVQNGGIFAARPSSGHRGGVNVLYCDGHVDFLDSSIMYRMYAQLLSVDSRQLQFPGTTLSVDPMYLRKR